MAFPKLLRRLFENEGAGPKLNSDVLPDMDYLPLAGGTMTGSLFFDSTNATNGNIDVGFDWEARTGSGIGFRGLNSTQTPGEFSIYARDATNSCDLKGTPAGALTWSGSSMTLPEGGKLSLGSGYLFSSSSTSGSYTGVYLEAYNGTTRCSRLILRSSASTSETGYVQLTASDGSNSRTLRLQPEGTGSWDGTFQAVTFKSTSDIRKKENIQAQKYDLSTLGTYSYNFKDDEKKVPHVGLIAQEVETVIPEAVSETEDGTKVLDYNAVVAALVSEVNALKQRISELEAK